MVRAPISQDVFYEENGDHNRDVNPKRLEILQRPKITTLMHDDGLQQVNYTLLRRHDYTSFVRLLCDL